MSEPRGVSIIIPNYNYGRFIGEAIDSALAQTHAPVEVIVVDDGSTDESRAVIKSYGDRIKAVFQENAGQTRACCTGFRLVTNPIVMFLDSDDRLVPEAAALAARDWPDGVSKKQFRLQTLNAYGELLDNYWPKYPSETTAAMMRSELLRTGYYPCPPTTGNAFSCDFLARISPFDAHAYVDSVINTLAPLYGDVITHSDVIGHYRIHGSNTYCATDISVTRFAKYLAGDDDRVAILGRHCAWLGIDFVGPEVLDHLLPYRELLAIIAKLEATSYSDRRRAVGLAIEAVKVGGAYPQSRWHRSLRAAWIVGVGIAPRRLAELLIGLRYASAERPPALERFIVGLGRKEAVS